jgi:hypothetical protein
MRQCGKLPVTIFRFVEDVSEKIGADSFIGKILITRDFHDYHANYAGT